MEIPSINEDMTSSPDPLGLSDENTTFTSSPSKDRASNITSRKPLIETSSNSASQEFYFSTPTPTKKRPSPAREEAPSPWRIRVTLEAESVDRGQKLGGLQEQTIVTKIPLKGSDDSSPAEAKRGRGRPRKSLGSPIKRTGTPKPKYHRSKTMPDPADGEEDIFMWETSPFAKRGDAFPRRRARKSPSPSKQHSQATPEPQTATASDNLSEAKSKRKRSRSRKRRTEITPMKLIRNPEDSPSDSLIQASESLSHRGRGDVSGARTMASLNDDQGALQVDEQAEVNVVASFLERSTLQMVDKNNREATPDPTDEHHDFDTILESEGFSMVSVETLSSAGQHSKSPTKETGSPRLDLPTQPGHLDINSPPLQEQSVHGYSDISSSIPASASPTKMSHLPAHMSAAIPKSSPSIAQSAHGYSDISSLPPEAPLSNRVAQLRRKPRGQASSHSPSMEQNPNGYPDISSIAPDEPSHITGTRKLLLRSTPTNTSPPPTPAAPIAVQNTSSLRPLNEVTDVTPKFDRTRQAGNALQGLSSPNERMIQYSDRLGSPFQEDEKPSPFLTVEKATAKHENPSQPESKESLAVNVEKLFSDFGGGTKGEFKAGLRLGEELAKRHTESASSLQFDHAVEANSFVAIQTACNPTLTGSTMKAASSPPKQGQSEVSYPSLPHHQLPSPAESVLDDDERRMRWKADTPIQPVEPVLSINPDCGMKSKSLVPEASLIEDTLMAREAEWQREREAVSEAIQMANASQVIIINSDDSADSQGTEGIIDAFAGFTSELRSPNMTPEPQSQTSDLFLQAEVAKPWRSKLPSPWRRSGQIYSDDPGPELTESDIFWQPDQAQAKAAKNRQERKRQARAATTETSVLDKKDLASLEIKQILQAPLKEALTLSEVSRTKDSPQAPHAESKLALPEECGAFGDLKTQESVLLEEYEDSEDLEEMHDSYRSDDITQDNLNPKSNLKADETLTVSSIKEIDSCDGWSSQGLTFIDPKLHSTTKKATHTTTQNVANKTSIISSPTPTPNPTATSAITAPSTTTNNSWLSTLTHLFTHTSNPPIPWYNSPPHPLPPATPTDILASSPNIAISPTTPWTKAHQNALIPLYQSSWLFGAHIFLHNPDSPAAGYENRTLRTALGWSRKVKASDVSVVDAFMLLLAARSKRYNPAKNPNHVSPPAEHQYGRSLGQRIDAELVLMKCVEIWQDMVMCGDVEPPREGEGVKVGLRRKGDKVWSATSWWDVEGERSQKGYFERKRRDWGGLPSWRAKGLI